MPNTSQQQTAPANNQSPLMMVATGVLILIAVMLFLNLTKQGESSPNSNDDRLADLQQKVAAKEQELLSQGISLPTAQPTLEELTRRISADADSLRSAASSIQSTLSEKETALSKAQANLKAALTTNEQLSSETAKLRTQLQQLEGKALASEQLKQSLASLQQQLLNKEQEILTLSSRPTQEVVNQFRASLNETRLTNEGLIKKISTLETQLAKAADPTELDSLKQQLAALLPENEKLKLELQKLRAATDFDSLFVKSSSDLRPEALKLYAALEQLENLSPEQLTAAYAEISQQLNAHMVRKVNFNTNSSSIDWKEVVSITDTIQSATPNSFFLVVGYASKTGSVEDNKVLSAKRSVTIASTVKQLKGADGTRAVFLGQTNRFSQNPTENQICEIWEIRK